MIKVSFPSIKFLKQGKSTFTIVFTYIIIPSIKHSTPMILQLCSIHSYILHGLRKQHNIILNYKRSLKRLTMHYQLHNQ